MIINKKVIQVKAIWDNEVLVWVATSNDVPGLVTESENIENLIQKLKIMIPELLEANGMLLNSQHKEIPFNLLSERTEVAVS